MKFLAALIDERFGFAAPYPSQLRFKLESFNSCATLASALVCWLGRAEMAPSVFVTAGATAACVGVMAARTRRLCNTKARGKTRWVTTQMRAEASQDNRGSVTGSAGIHSL